MKNLEGKQIVHALHGRDGRAQSQPGGGGGATKLAREMQVCWGRGGSPDFLGLEMVFSTFSTRYFSAKTQPG